VTVFAAPVVDWATLGEVIVYSLLAGVGVSICFSLAIVGSARLAESRRGESGGGGAAIGYAVLAALGLAATVAAVVLGIIVMTTKG
jgi:hypothetical protein